MSLLNRISAALRRKTPERRQSRSAVIGAQGEYNEMNWPDLGQYTAQGYQYAASSWVYQAITRISQECALVRLNVSQVVGEKKTPIDNHPIERMLRSPNPYQSGYEFLESLYAFQDLNGNAFMYMTSKSGSGTPDELWILRPDRVRVAVDRHDYISGYVYTIGGNEIPLMLDEVVHFKRWHPVDDLQGLSPLMAAALASQSDVAMSTFNRNTFAKGAVIPAGIITIKSMITDNEFARIQEEYTKNFAATQRKTAFIRGSGANGIQWDQIGLTHQELSFIESRKMTQEEIYGIYNIPMGIIRENATEASAKIATMNYKAGCLWPRLTRTASKLTKDLAPFFGTDLVIDPEEIRDVAPDPGQIGAARDYLTVNEARQRWWNLGTVEGGDFVPAVEAYKRAEEQAQLQIRQANADTNAAANAPRPSVSATETEQKKMLSPGGEYGLSLVVTDSQFRMPPAHPGCDCKVIIQWDYHTDGYAQGMKMIWAGTGTSCETCSSRIGKEIKDIAPIVYRRRMDDELSQMERWARNRVGKLVGKSFDSATLPPNVIASILDHAAECGDVEQVKGLFKMVRDSVACTET